jgi:hypothetical protein
MIKNFALLPPGPDVCQICAVDHPPELPHNRESLFYQCKFFLDYKRWPTWSDAMAHCSDDIKRQWTEALLKRGVTV